MSQGDDGGETWRIGGVGRWVTWSARKKNPGRLATARIPSVLTGPVHPFGSLATLSVPPSERLRPIALRPHLATGLPLSGRHWVGCPPLLTRRSDSSSPRHL